MLERRELILGTAAAALGGGAVANTPADKPMYGLIGKMLAKPGHRDALLAILLDGTGAMPGCLSYVLAKDPTNPDAIWITETWDNAESHTASLQLPAVQAAITKARPLIAGFGERFETQPVGGVGLGGPTA
ncbi:putative quinol monooxygenase [Phenylobacterium sp.]|uniref:putative quinol monooxygenase n=1 Tax=Phenylobacterium sp. TaxID=1871053 RepID=UPI003D2B61B1